MCDAIAIFLAAGAAAWAAGSLVGLVYLSWRLWRHWTVTSWADEYNRTGTDFKRPASTREVHE